MKPDIRDLLWTYALIGLCSLPFILIALCAP